jgi:hypothetical protein
MEENDLIKYGSHHLQKVGNAITITDKILALNERQNTIDFFIQNLNLFKILISRFYPLSPDHLKKFENFWLWGGQGISSNQEIRWHEEFIDNVEDRLAWSVLTNNESIIWSERLIEKYKSIKFDKSSWSNLSWNRKIHFTEDFLYKYRDDLDWNILSGNQGIPWADNLIDKYKDKLNWDRLSENTAVAWSESLIDKYFDFWNWHLLAGNPSIEWNNPTFLKKYEANINYNDFARNISFNWTIEIIKEFAEESWDWDELSEFLQIWDEKTIDLFFSHIDFVSLSHNNSMQWSESLIDKYFDKWDWKGLSGNTSLPFTKSFIGKYSIKWDWNQLSTNHELHWSIELINDFKLMWNQELLGRQSNRYFLNVGFWEKAFKSKVDDNMIEEIILKSLK